MYFCHKNVIFKFFRGFWWVCLTKIWTCLVVVPDALFQKSSGAVSFRSKNSRNLKGAFFVKYLFSTIEVFFYQKGCHRYFPV